MSTPTTATWPADVIHVNEDGWVLVNRGQAHGVVPGLRLLVVGQRARELRDLFAADGSDAAPVLRIRRTYELLDVVHVEEHCAIAIAARTPPERQPQCFRGTEGELLVWVPLPADFTWPLPGPTPDEDSQDVTAAGDDVEEADGAGDAGEEEGVEEEAGGTDADIPPERGEQDDERWEQSLPLNGVAVGDLVVPAIPVSAGASPIGSVPALTGVGQASGAADGSANPFEAGRAYDWMQPRAPGEA